MNIKVEKFLQFSWLILLPLLSTFPIKADEWSVDANINQGFSYDDNVTMREEGEDSFIYKVTPVVYFAHRTEVSEISANASYGYEHFFDLERFNRDNQKYEIEGQYSMTERLDWRLSSDYSIAPGRDTASEDSGIFDDSEKETFSISPTLSYKLTEQDNLSLSGVYRDASYTITRSGNKLDLEGIENTDIERPLNPLDQELIDWASSRLASGKPNDYESMSVYLRWGRSWSERFNSSLGASYSRYESENHTPSETVIVNAGDDGEAILDTDNINESTTSDSIEITLSSSYMLFENWELYGEFGGRFTKIKDNINADKNNGKWKKGFVFDVGTVYTGESLSADLSINQSIAPSARDGRTEERFGINLDLNHIITERLSVALLSTYQESESIGRSNQRTNFSVSPAVNWRLSPDWTVSTSYRYRYQKRPVGSEIETANSNLYMISLNYRWQGLSISR